MSAKSSSYPPHHRLCHVTARRTCHIFTAGRPPRIQKFNFPEERKLCKPNSSPRRWNSKRRVGGRGAAWRLGGLHDAWWRLHGHWSVLGARMGGGCTAPRGLAVTRAGQPLQPSTLNSQAEAPVQTFQYKGTTKIIQLIKCTLCMRTQEHVCRNEDTLAEGKCAPTWTRLHRPSAARRSCAPPAPAALQRDWA